MFFDSFFAESPFLAAVPTQFKTLLEALLGEGTGAERALAVESILEAESVRSSRGEIGKWTARMLAIETLVPEIYKRWRPLVGDGLAFVFSRLSPARLAPKIVEQVEMAADTAPEVRLTRLIAKMPGLQKLGQVLARNRHLDPALRRELSALENGIRDAEPNEVRAIILNQLGPRLGRFEVEIEPSIFSEASVSAVMRFTWKPSPSASRERGVFKVLKPHVLQCFTEDLDLLERLAGFIGANSARYGFAAHDVGEMIREIRVLLEAEIDFVHEQANLDKARQAYEGVAGLRIPRLIRALCSAQITAMTEENGVKITDAFPRASTEAMRVARKAVSAIIAAPLFCGEENAAFHADPHAGNLLFDQRTEELVMLDWALMQSLSCDQRRHLLKMFLMLMLRDEAGVEAALSVLVDRRSDTNASNSNLIGELVREFMAELPCSQLPSSVDALRLVDRLALGGVRFPAALLMFRKAVFTLDGVLHDIAGPEFSLDALMAADLMQSWVGSFGMPFPPFVAADWLALQWSALTYGSRLWARALIGAADAWGSQASVSSCAWRAAPRAAS